MKADPNPNLTVQLFRPPFGPWVGIRRDEVASRGQGWGLAAALDTSGEIGRVAMSVLVPFPTVSTEPASRPVPVSD